jgi:hypothetical protein
MSIVIKKLYTNRAGVPDIITMYIHILIYSFEAIIIEYYLSMGLCKSHSNSCKRLKLIFPLIIGCLRSAKAAAIAIGKHYQE